MEYLYKLQKLLETSEFYTEFLAKLPPPLNNAYFDLIVLIIIAVAVMKWFFSSIAMHIRHKKVRKRQSEIKAAQEQAEIEALHRERELRRKQEATEDMMMKWMQMCMMMQVQPKMHGQYNTVGASYMPSLEEFVSGKQSVSEYIPEAKIVDVSNISHLDNPDSIIEIEEENIIAFPKEPLLLSDNGINQTVDRNIYTEENSTNEFERLMAQAQKEASVQSELSSKQAIAEAEAREKSKELNQKLKVNVKKGINDEKIIQIDPERQKEIEKRKAIALKIALREQEKAKKRKR